MTKPSTKTEKSVCPAIIEEPEKMQKNQCSLDKPRLVRTETITDSQGFPKKGLDRSLGLQ